MKRRVVITGMGAITPLGATAPEFWSEIKKGSCGIAPIRAYDTSEMSAKLAAEVTQDLSELLTPKEMRQTDRYTQLALIAAREAIADSGINADNTNLTRTDVLVSSGIGGMASTVNEYQRGTERGFDRISPFYIPMTIANIAAGRIAIEHGLKGDCSCIVTACTSSTHAIGEAMRHIRHGYADAVVCGGAEATVLPLAIGGFTSMQALHLGSDPSRASIPFDAERSGFVLGEGAGVLVLEEYEQALARGARIYAEVAGFGASCDAYHITAPSPDGSGAIAAMSRALTDAELEPADISYINAHGTSTPLNDAGEAKAIQAVFGVVEQRDGVGVEQRDGVGVEQRDGVGVEQRDGVGVPLFVPKSGTPTPSLCSIPVSSTKSMTGHLLGAAGAVEALVCAMSLHEGFIPPTVNYRVSDPECPLDVVPNEGRREELSAALSNSFGFGGHNASLVLARIER